MKPPLLHDQDNPTTTIQNNNYYYINIITSSSKVTPPVTFISLLYSSFSNAMLPSIATYNRSCDSHVTA